MKCVMAVLSALAVAACSQLLYDPYHALHLPGAYQHYRAQASYHQRNLLEGDSCSGRPSGYYAHLSSGCEKYYRCQKERIVSTEQCTEGTLFNEQFQVCDHFYNVRCGSPYEDL